MHVLENYDKIIVLGDFNIHVDKETVSKAIEFMNLLSSMYFIQHVTWPTNNAAILWPWLLPRGFLLTYPLLWMLLYLITTVFFSTLLPIAQCNTERIINKRYVTSEVTTVFIDCMNNTSSPILPSSCDDLVDNFNSKLRATIDAIDPVKLKKDRSKRTVP